MACPAVSSPVPPQVFPLATPVKRNWVAVLAPPPNPPSLPAPRSGLGVSFVDADLVGAFLGATGEKFSFTILPSILNLPIKVSLFITFAALVFLTSNVYLIGPLVVFIDKV